MVSIKYFLDVGELRRTKSIPFGTRTSKRSAAPGGGACPSRLSVHSNASTLALGSRPKGNSNLSLKFTESDCVKSVPCASHPAAEPPSVDAEHFEVAASRIVVQLQCQHVPGRIDRIIQGPRLLLLRDAGRGALPIVDFQMNGFPQGECTATSFANVQFNS